MQERPLNAVQEAPAADPSADHVSDSQAPDKPDILDQIRAAIRRPDVGYWKEEFPCPGPHDNKDQAVLTVSRGYDQRGVSVRCSGPKDYKGDRCRPQDILKPLGMTTADLNPDADAGAGLGGDWPDADGTWQRLEHCPLCGKDNCSISPDGSTLICWRPWLAPEDHGGVLDHCDSGDFLKVPLAFSPAIQRLKQADQAQPSPLAPHHRQLVQARYGLTDATIRAASLHTLEGEALGRALKWNPTTDAVKLGPAVVIPYRSRDGSLNCYLKVRPDRPVQNKDGNPRKYMGPVGVPTPVFLPPGITDAVLDNTTVPLIVVEGEFKALKAVQEKFPCVAIGGVDMWSAPRPKGEDGRRVGPKVLGNGLEKIAWKGRRTFIVFDSDKNTNPRVLRAERDFAKALRQAGADVRLVALPPLPGGGKCGLDDFLIQYGAEALRKLLEETATATKAGLLPKKADCLVGLVEGAELFHDAQRRAYLAVEVDGHRETMEVGTEACRLWLARESHRAGLGVPSELVLKEAEGVLKGKALFDGPERQVFLRVGEYKDAVYLDLGDSTWRAVKITKDGWKVVKKSKVFFRRTPGMLPLPVPQRGGDLTRLRTLFNLDDDRNYRLAVGWLLGTLMPAGPYPILAVTGEQGTAKSCVCRGLRHLIDPHDCPLGNVPREERSLGVKALGNHVVALDNLSRVPDWLSDALCRVATGAGFSERKLYTDSEESTLRVCRPLLLNGIASEMLGRPDLLDRALMVELPVIPEEARKPEADFWCDLEAARPKLLGALLDAAAVGLQRLPDIRLDRLPRMADFARWVEACGPALGLKPGDFVGTLAEVRDESDAQTLGNWPVYPVLKRWLKEEWEGLVSDLDAKLEEARHESFTKVSDRVRYSSDWPKTSGVLSAHLKRHAPALRRAGITMTWPRRGKHGQPVRLERVAPPDGV
jgi:hypothetical protein